SRSARRQGRRGHPRDRGGIRLIAGAARLTRGGRAHFSAAAYRTALRVPGRGGPRARTSACCPRTPLYCFRNNGPTPAALDGAMHSTFLVGRTLRIGAAMVPKLFPVFFIVKLVEWLPDLITLTNPGTSTSDTVWSAGAAFLTIVLGTVS